MSRVPRRAGLRASLANYASMRLVRDNAMAFCAALFVVVLLGSLPAAGRKVAHHGLAVLFSPRSPLLMPFWMTCFFLPAMLIHHYWRQVRSSIAVIVPGLIASEFQAVLIALGVTLLVLAAPLLWLGAPIPGALALVGFGMTTGGGFGTAVPTGQSAGWRRFQGLLFIPLVLIGLLPHKLAWIVFAPWPAAFTILAASVLLIVLGLRYRPAQAEAQAAQLDQMRDKVGHATPGGRSPNRAARAAGAARPVLRLLLWHPGGTARDPAPPMLASGLGPIGTILLILVQFGVLVLLFPMIAMLSGDSLHRAIEQQAPGALSLAAAAVLLPRTQWLLNRGEWPFLLSAGRFGSRRDFAAAMFRTHRGALLQVAAASAVIATALAAALGLVTPRAALPAGICIAGLVFGAGYLPSTPLLWGEFGGKGLITAFGTAGYMTVMLTLSFGLFDHGTRAWVFGLAAALTAFGATMAVIAPRCLAAMDWPME